MLRNFIRVAFRNLLKDKFYSLINVLGLALGIACCIFIVIFVNDELSYDKFNSKVDQTYRIIEFINSEGAGERSYTSLRLSQRACR